MKKLLLALFSLSTLSACQSTVLDSQGVDDEAGMSTQYSDSRISGKTPADLNTQLGAGYIGNGRYDRALVKLNKALQQDPQHALAHNYLGVLYSRLERPQLAYKHFNRSVQLSPNDSSILNNYAIFLCEQKKFDEARVKFKKVINNPLYINRAGAYQSAGWCAMENNNLPLSEELYRKSLDISPNLSGSLFGLAKLNYQQENYIQAWDYFQRYDQVTIPDADALWLGVNILNSMSNPDRNLLSSYELQLKSKYPESDETKMLYQGKQGY